MPVASFTKTGSKATTEYKLDKSIFGLKDINHELLKSAYVAYLANGRVNLAVTKTRGLVSGGGKKPWRQKGTGRARFGSSRNPIWRGGGIAFGPTGEENYKQKLHRNAKRLAIRQALSLANDSGKLIVIEDIVTKNKKTSEAVTLLKKIGSDKTTLVVVSDKNPEITRAFNNIPKVKIVQANYLNVYDCLNADKIVLTNPSLPIITAWLGEKK